MQRENSMLTFETSAVQGTSGIIEKLTVRFAYPTSFRRIANTPTSESSLSKNSTPTLDAQPSSESGGILVLVTGALLVWWPGHRRCSTPANWHWLHWAQVDEEQKPMSYTQAFQLQQDASGNYFVFNDVFRLIYNAA
jgi:hypothetical protein